jgi:hypothetical protein
MRVVVESGAGFYITFTNPISQAKLITFKRVFESLFGQGVLDDSYVIDLVKYDALKGEVHEMS